MAKLFSIKTTDEIIRVPKLGVTHFNCTVNWFCRGRPMSVMYFCEKKLGWVNVSGNIADFAYQYFTESEAEEVVYFLQCRFGASPEVEQIYLPLSEIDTPFSRIPPEPVAGDNYGFVHLGHINDMGMQLSGYYDKEYENASARFQIASVKALMESSGLDSGTYKFD